MIRRIAGKIRKNKQAVTIALIGVVGVLFLVTFRACTPEPPKVAFEPAPITETVLTEEERAEAAVTYAQKSLDFGYDTSSREYEATLKALSRDVDTTFPLTGNRFADCLIDQCQWALRDSTVTPQDNGQFLVEGVIRVTGRDGTSTQPYGAYIDVDAYGKVTNYAPLATEGNWD